MSNPLIPQKGEAHDKYIKRVKAYCKSLNDDNRLGALQFLYLTFDQIGDGTMEEIVYVVAHTFGNGKADYDELMLFAIMSEAQR